MMLDFYQVPLATADERSRTINKYQRLMPMAWACADQSKLPGTHVGAAVFGEDFEPLSSGWNGAPRGCRADEDGRSIEREERLLWTVHAEANAIANAARSGHRLKGATMLCTLMPCLPCASLIVQAGIKRIICPEPTGDIVVRWGEHFARTRMLFRECGVECIEFDTTE